MLNRFPRHFSNTSSLWPVASAAHTLSRKRRKNTQLMTLPPALYGSYSVQSGKEFFDPKEKLANEIERVITRFPPLAPFLPLKTGNVIRTNPSMEYTGFSKISGTRDRAKVLNFQSSKPALHLLLFTALLISAYSTELIFYDIPTLSTNWPGLPERVIHWMQNYLNFGFSTVEMVLLCPAPGSYIGEIPYEKERTPEKSRYKLQREPSEEKNHSVQLDHGIGERTVEISPLSQLPEQEVDQIKVLDMIKSSVFTNFSHEFHTPLTLIRAPLQNFLDGNYGPLEGPAIEAVELAARNTDRLTRMIEEMLMLAELESGAIDLRSTEQDINGFCRSTAALFSHTANERNIAFEVIAADGELPAFFDLRKLEKVLCNLLSNAFKHCAKDGRVSLSVRIREREQIETDGDFVEIAVCDNGAGIAEEEKPNIFDRSHRSDGSEDNSVKASHGSLALVKELVELHGGKFYVASSLSAGLQQTMAGSCFYVVLPLQHLPSRPGEIRVDNFHSTGHRQVSQMRCDTAENHCRETLLVVEGNTEMRDIVVSKLEPEYRVLQAVHGQQALQVLEDEAVDLILSGITMPKLDGIELLKQVRSNPVTLHLPVVLLNVRNCDKHRLNALHVQANDILVKPFQDEELRLKISDLLKRDHRSRTVTANTDTEHIVIPDVPVDSAATVFLEKATKVVQGHMSSAEFDVAALANALHISRSTLQRRLENYAGVTPAEFIRQLRLHKAHQYLQSGHFRTLAETAYAVGFGQAGYFSRLYRKFAAELTGGNC